MIHSQLMNKLKSIIFDESHIDQNIMILSGKPITMKNDFIFSIASHISSSKSQIHYFDINSLLFEITTEAVIFFCVIAFVCYCLY